MAKKMASHWIAAVLTLALIPTGAAGPAYAASTSGTIELTGTVPVQCEIIVQNVDGQLDLVDGEIAKQVAEISESCNDPAGYTLTIASQNGGGLVGSNGTVVSYLINYDGQAGADLATDLVLDRAEARFGFVKPLQVSVEPNAQVLAGRYDDVITVTIAAR